MTKTEVKENKKISYSRFGYYFIIPFFVAFIVFQVYPNVYTIVLSFTDMQGFNDNIGFVGFNQYKWILQNSSFWKSLFNTVIIWIINFIPQLLCALSFAMILTAKRITVKGKKFFKTVFYLPNIMTAATVASLFAQMFAFPNGTITMISQNLGLINEDFQFMQSQWAARLIVCFIQFLMWTGPTMIMLISAMVGIDDSLYEAAVVDGSSLTRCFFKITLPLIKPIMLYVLVTSLVGGLQVFDIPFLFNNGGPLEATTTTSLFIYKIGFTGDNNFGGAAAGSVILMLIAIVCSVFLFIFMKGDNYASKQSKKK